MSKRVQSLLTTWYIDQRKYSMTSEEWLYCGQLIIACTLAFGLGLLIGFIWLIFI